MGIIAQLVGYYGETKWQGEKHKNAKLTNQEVFDIREQRLNGKDRMTVYEKYKDKISIKGFQHIWEGDRFTKIHMDVYENVPVVRKPKLTDEQVAELRKDFLNGLTKKELIDKYNVNRRTVERIIQNKTRKETENDFME